ncbi:MAG: hypothetical protein WD185_08410 [Sneathiella sp.]
MTVMIVTRLFMALGLVLLGAQFAQASYEAGQEALDQNNATAAIEEWQPVAKRGDAKAQYALGQIFEKGAEGVDVDLIDAFTWYNLAAAQGYESADTAVERLKGSMSLEEVQDAQAQSLAALGFWFRDFTGQDEAAFQVAKAAVREQDQQQAGNDETLAEQRAAEQRELIAQRKADAEAKARALEESREASILAAQAQAEEAKRQAALREQQIEEQRIAIAQKDTKNSQSDADAARARLAALMAKQNGSAPISAAAVPANQSAITKVEPATETTALAKSDSVSGELTGAKAQPDQLAKSNSEPKAQIVAATQPEPKPQRTEVTKPAAPEKNVETIAAEPALTEEKSAALASLKKKSNLDKDAVEQIFEQAKIANLDTPTAQAEIEQSIVRIEALKWSLISGAKGDTAAPKMNKVLMSKMSPVQIAEANRLAGEWLIERQSEL